MKTKQLVLISFFILVSLAILGCAAVTSQPSTDDCGYLATYPQPAEGKSAEITFSMVMAEIVNDHKNCGFGFRPGRVDKAEINGKALTEKANGDKYLYIAPPGFDPAKDTIYIEANGKSYSSTPGKTQGDAKSISISLRPSPHK